MKQHITTKQLEELNGKQMLALRKWTGAEEGALPLLLSIGQMIEFLMEHDKHRTYISWDAMAFGATWFGKIEHDKKKNQIVFRDGYGYGELADTLWEAVKEALNES